jgi:hypothetical protein
MNMNLTKQHQFDRLPRESVKAYTAFRTYLDIGVERSLAAVATKLGKSKVLIERWSRRYDWTARVAAHLAYLGQIEHEAIESLAREKAIEWHKLWEEQRIAEWKARCDALELAQRLIERWRKNEHKCGTAEGIARLLELVHKLGRSATGMPIQTLTVSGEIKATLEVEWEVALKKVYGKAQPTVTVVDVEAVEKTEGRPAQLPAGASTEKGT